MTPEAPSDVAVTASDPHCLAPGREWRTSPADFAAAKAGARKRGANTVTISLDAKDQLSWDKHPVDQPGFRQFLERELTRAPEPVMIFQADRRASCNALREVADHMNKTFCSGWCLFQWSEIPPDPKRGAPVFLPAYPL
jgi:hypothetical protein